MSVALHEDHVRWKIVILINDVFQIAPSFAATTREGASCLMLIPAPTLLHEHH